MRYKPEKNSKIKFIRIENGKSLVYIPKTKKVKTLNVTGTIILSLCDGEHTLENMAMEIEKRFEGVTKKEIQTDIANYIGLLKKEGILHG
ncbi:MAG: PqqD family protein [Candidatus Methanofastidiosia archaeon]|jgi:hypothetical protein